MIISTRRIWHYGKITKGDIPVSKLIMIITRLSRGIATATVVVISLVMFISSLIAFHAPEVIAVLLLRTVQGYLQLFVLFATSTLPLFCLVLTRRKKKDPEWSNLVKVVIASTVTGFYFLSLSLLYYRIKTGAPFDLSILWYHFEDGLRTLLVLSKHYTGPLILFASLTVYHFYGVLIIISSKRIRWAGTKSVAVSIGCLVALIASQSFSENGIRNLLYEAKRGASQARSLYIRHFEESIRRNQTGRAVMEHDTSRPNLFIVQLESINAALVTPEVTPNLLGLVEDRGVVFSRIQAPSVFTILSMETLLCGTLPTLEKNLAQMDSLHSRFNCLPRVLKEKGFKTLYFQAYPNLDFNNMKSFLRAIGFDEIHAEDIMRPGDPRLKWGFVEDVFYRRVFAYLEKFRDEKIFVYILPGSANHYPFYDAEMETMFVSLKPRLPYQVPRNIRERMANTMFIQDHFFGEMYRQLYRGPFGAKSQMFVLGDHSWPIEVHSGNSNNLKGAFQENFATAMAFIPKKQLQPIASVNGRLVPRLYSYLDFFATVLEMYGVKQFRSHGNSLMPELENNVVSHGSNRCVLSVQPFSGGQIAVINYPKKYIFDLKHDSVTLFNLETDGDERSAAESIRIDGDKLALLESCLRNLTAHDGSLQTPN